MMLNQMTIKNLTAFPEATLNFSDGLNVIIGENGSGKSHILKAAYSVIAASAEEGRKGKASPPTKGLLQKLFAAKLMSVFRPDSLGRLVRRKKGREQCELGFVFSQQKLNTKFSFSPSSKTDVQIDQLPVVWGYHSPVFLPTRELLTIYPGFISMYENRYLEFEETYRDTCLLLGAPALKGLREKEIVSLLKPLEKAMGGTIFLSKSGRFYLSIPGQVTMEMFLVAEGLRKLAMLARLISTGSLLDKGYLFWDEPEANLNPKLVKVIAEVILHLCKNGIQVFIATHSLFLLRELEILSYKEPFKGVACRYFALPLKESGVEVEQGNAVDDLQSLILLDEELEQSDRFMSAGE
jgi:energy-coupling factor transporter ATP-binding protein EcfA2